MYGPWLLYINSGDLDDAGSRSAYEDTQWPYWWLNDTNYQNRGSLQGTLVLSDGRPACGAAVFLGDENGWETNNQGSQYQYTTYADENGYFQIDAIRTQKDYRLLAWSNGGSISDVSVIHNGTMVSFNDSQSVDLGQITWDVPQRDVEWRIGDFDKKALGFKLGGSPLEHGLSDKCPANLVYAIGTNQECDWYFAQSAQGNWTVIFDPASGDHVNRSAVLTLAFAGYTSQNGYGLGRDSYTYPEIPPTGLNISMNAHYVETVVSENATDGALYRSATTSGGYYASEITIPAEFILTDKPNRLDL